jgi:ATP-dependent helicase HrpB
MAALSPLPIDQALPQICAALAQHGILVLSAPPGSGKTTRVPAALTQHPAFVGQRVAVSEPRRIAARAAAQRVAQERGLELGQEVGFQVRHERQAREDSGLVYFTHGMLLELLKGGVASAPWGVFVLDEFHERGLDSDLLLGALLAARRQALAGGARGPSLLVMSATLDGEALAARVGGAFLEVAVPSWPVELSWEPGDQREPLEQRVAGALTRHSQRPGDVLVFLPGAGEIERCRRRLGPVFQGRETCVLHGSLSLAAQKQILVPGARSRVILATNVAESSLTVPGVRTVIDSGLERRPLQLPGQPFQVLETLPSALASLVQRAGRAGREAPGLCVRLFTKAEEARREPFRPPEILGADLAPALLQVLGMGFGGLSELPLLDPPAPEREVAAAQLLARLGMCEGGQLTPRGRRALRLPFHPRIARLVLEAGPDEVPGAVLAAVLLEGSTRRPSRAETDLPGFDFLTELEDWAAALGAGRARGGAVDPEQVPELRRSLTDALARLGAGGGLGGLGQAVANREGLSRLLLRAFPDFVCARSGNANFQSFQGLKLETPKALARSCETMLVLDVAGTLRGPGEAAAKLARPLRFVPMEAGLLLDEVPELVSEAVQCDWNEGKRRVEVFSRLRYGPLTIGEGRLPRKAWPQEATALLQSKLAALPLGALLEVAELEALQGRWLLAFGGHWEDPEGTLLADLEARIRAQVGRLAAGANGIDEVVAARPLASFLGTLSGDERRRLEDLCPTHLGLPGRKKVPVHYAPGKRPMIESRIQDFFRLAKGPVVGKGGLPLVLHLLAPSGRPVQVTDDLAGFWVRHYPAIKKQLQRQYPKHRWPDDPVKPTTEPRPPGRG